MPRARAYRMLRRRCCRLRAPTSCCGSASFPSLTHVDRALSSPVRLPRPSSANEEGHPLAASFALLRHCPPSPFTASHEHHCPLRRCGADVAQADGTIREDGGSVAVVGGLGHHQPFEVRQEFTYSSKDNTNYGDDGIQIEPYNLKQEREEGYFDENGNFVEYAKQNEIKLRYKWRNVLQ